MPTENPNHQGCQGGNQNAGPETQPEIDLVLDQEYGHAVSPQAVKGRLAEGQLPHGAEEEIETQGKEAHDQSLSQYEEIKFCDYMRGDKA
jgi:hypothetical protein